MFYDFNCDFGEDFNAIAGCLFLVEFLQTRQSTFKISCQIAVIRDTDTQQNVILNTFLKIIIPLAEINQAV